MKKISVIGSGYVGLCTAASFAVKGYQVIVTDKDSRRIEMVKKCISPFYETELENLLKKGIRSGKFKAVVGSEEAIMESDIIFVAVGTPSLPDGSIDLKHIRDSAQEIGTILQRKDNYSLITLKSTIVPGTTENIIKPILEKYSKKSAGQDFGLCMNPEFLREGSAINDIFHPDMIIIGEYDRKSGQTLEELYREFYKSTVHILRMGTASAEMVKYAINSFLATKISFINEIANICERVQSLDVVEVARAMGLDSRISPRFLSAGAGWGGSCLPKDVRALHIFSTKKGYKPKLLEAAISVNVNQIRQIVDLVIKELGNLEGKKIAILGLSFKPNTNDMREASSIEIIDLLLSQEAQVYAFDPVAIDNAKKILDKRVNYATTIDECLQNADCCIIVTEWDEFKKLQPEDFIQSMKKPLLIDCRRIYDQKDFSKKLRFKAIGLGRLT